MALDLTTITPPTTPDPKVARSSVARKLGLGLLGLTAMGVGGALWHAGIAPRHLWAATPIALDTLEVLAAPLAVVVVETGTVESASNTSVKCQVEALVGTVGGTSGATRPSGGTSTGSSSSSQSAAPAAAPTMTKSTAQSITAKSAAKKKANAASSASMGESSGGSGSSGGGSRSGSSGGGSGSGSGGSGGSEGSSSGGGMSGSKSSSSSSNGSAQVAITQRPTIRSFTYTVTPYTSLQTKRSATVATKSASQGQSGGGGGGGNRGGGGGGGNGNGEKPGSTRIIMIRNEGDVVAAGDVVCEFDSAAFRDAVLAQQIKADTAKSAMVQAQSILEVNQIALSEYRDGIYPQDLQLIRQYLSTCRKEEDRAQRNVAWSKQVLDMNFRAPQQHQAEVLSLQRAEIALVVAKLMEDRLVNSTGPKIIKSLEAKLQANKADAFALEAAYGTEADRLKKLERMVVNCTLRAPHEGTVVYSLPPSNGWRPATPTIMEGATVREGQPIFELPDPKRMRIRAKVNESKVGAIHTGQRASVRIDAFPDRRLLGTVGDITLIPAPGSGPGSDVRIYFANIVFDGGDFEGLRPGLSAEVSFLVDDREAITQIPIKAIRWVGQSAFAALSTSADRSTYRWQPIEVGSMNTHSAEIVRGLSVGDRIVAAPDSLPEPKLDLPNSNPATLQAGGPRNPQG